VVGDIACDDELRGLVSVVVGGGVVGVLESQLRAEEDCGANPVAVADQVFGVLGGEAGALPANIVDELVADGEVACLIELLLEIVDDSELWCVAA